jgi:hypothetical protein
MSRKRSNIKASHIPKINLEKGLAAVLARYYMHTIKPL